MQTLKIKYKTSEENISLIKEYQREYSNVLHCVYNRAKDNYSETEIKRYLKTLKNINLLGCWFIRSATKEGVQIILSGQDNIIFGGKKNFIQRCRGKISREEFLEKRLSKIYSVGEKKEKSNRYFRITQDCESFIFQPNKNTKLELKIDGQYRRYRKLLSKLYILQENKETPITYQLDSEYIYVMFDEAKVYKIKERKKIENRVFSIDLNPNYIGWSIVDWKSSSEFNVVKSGVFSTKLLNDKDFDLKGKGYSPNSKERIYLSNKRNFEIFEISKNLINKALYYKCSIFSIEDLSIKSSDKENGKKFNKLCNNLWNRDKLVNNLNKRCNIFDIKFIEVKPEYSSFIGNFLFRDLKLPDMVLASIEIGRRAYEFYNQYITKIKEKRKNIVQPIINDFRDRYEKSLEEFGLSGEFKDLVEIYYTLKKSKHKYRVSLDDLNLKFFRSFSKTSLILKTI